MTPRSNKANRGSVSRPSRFSRNAASVRTGSHVNSGGPPPFPLRSCPFVMFQSGSEKAHKRSGVEETDRTDHSPNPSKYFGLLARSRGRPTFHGITRQSRAQYLAVCCPVGQAPQRLLQVTRGFDAGRNREHARPVWTYWDQSINECPIASPRKVFHSASSAASFRLSCSKTR